MYVLMTEGLGIHVIMDGRFLFKVLAVKARSMFFNMPRNLFQQHADMAHAGDMRRLTVTLTSNCYRCMACRGLPQSLP